MSYINMQIAEGIWTFLKFYICMQDYENIEIVVIFHIIVKLKCLVRFIAWESGCPVYAYCIPTTPLNAAWFTYKQHKSMYEWDIY